MIKTTLKYGLGFLGVTFLAANFLLGYFGQSTIFLTISVYSVIGVFGWWVLGRTISDPKKSANLRLLVLSIILSMFSAEIVLRYITRTNLSYSELNGQLYYSSLYGRAKMQNFLIGAFPDLVKEMTVVNRPNSSKTLSNSEFSYIHQYNSIGLREVELKKDTSKTTIVALGDSFTEGQGAPQDSTWVKRFERKLNDRGPKKPIRCINGGLAGSDVFYEFRLLNKYLLDLQPDHVILAINTSDICDIVVRGGQERFLDDGRLHYNDPPWWEYIYQFSFVFRAAIHAFGDYDWMLLSPEQQQAQTAAAIEKIKSCILNDYVPLAEKEGFKLTVVLHPRSDELELDYFPFDTLADDQELRAQVNLIDLRQGFYDWKTQENETFRSIFWPIDLHHNSKGYDLWAEMLAESFEVGR